MTTQINSVNDQPPKMPMTVMSVMERVNARPGPVIGAYSLVVVSVAALLPVFTEAASAIGCGLYAHFAAAAFAGVYTLKNPNLSARSAFAGVAAATVLGAASGLYFLHHMEQVALAHAYEKPETPREIQKQPVVSSELMTSYTRAAICKDSSIPAVDLPDGRFKSITLLNEAAVRVPCPLIIPASRAVRPI